MSKNFIFTLVFLLSSAFTGSSFLLLKEKQSLLTSEERAFLVNLLEKSMKKFETCVADLTEEQTEGRVCLCLIEAPSMATQELRIS